MINNDNKIWYYVSGQEQFLINDYESVVDYITQNYTYTNQKGLDNLILTLVNEISNENQLVEHCMRQNLDPTNYMNPDLAYSILEVLEKELLGDFK